MQCKMGICKNTKWLISLSDLNMRDNFVEMDWLDNIQNETDCSLKYFTFVRVGDY